MVLVIATGLDGGPWNVLPTHSLCYFQETVANHLGNLFGSRLSPNNHVETCPAAKRRTVNHAIHPLADEFGQEMFDGMQTSCVHRVVVGLNQTNVKIGNNIALWSKFF